MATPVASTSTLPMTTTPLSVTKSFRPYYSPQELSQLIKVQATTRGDNSQKKEMSDTRIESYRQLACGYIERVGGRLGFPRRTIATAQTLYHRFHLTFPLREFSYQDVSISALLVASKLEDTLKKLREIQIAAFQISNLLEGGTGTGDGDTVAQEGHRTKLIAIERLILETICFNFSLHRSPFTVDSSRDAPDTIDIPTELGVSGKDTFGWVIRIGRAFSASKRYILLSHLLAIDVHRTLAPLSYPPHTIALACLYLTSFLVPGHRNSLDVRNSQSDSTTMEDGGGMPKFEPGWAADFESEEEDVEEIAHSLLNLWIQLCPSSSNQGSTFPSPSFSPATPSNVSPSASSIQIVNQPTSSKDRQLIQSGVPHTLGGQISVLPRRPEDFTKIKIMLRKIESSREQEQDQSVEGKDEKKRVRRNEGMDGSEVDKKRLRTSRWVGDEIGLGALMAEKIRLDALDQQREVRAQSRTETDTSGFNGDSSDSRRSRDAIDPKPISVRYRF